MPTFCKLHKNKTECKEKFHSSYFENHFALHGLWPQPRRNTYCDTEKYIKKLDRRGRWESLPKLELSTELRYELEKAMPGYKSFLHRHEWIKHGSCYGKNETEYFSTSIRLLREINESKVQEFFSNNIGKRIYIDKVRDIFNDTFGRDAGKRISLRCKSGYIAEVWLNLLGNIDGEADIKNLLKDSDKSSASCRNGILYKYTASQ
jgi:ribonuclease T2